MSVCVSDGGEAAPGTGALLSRSLCLHADVTHKQTEAGVVSVSAASTLANGFAPCCGPTLPIPPLFDCEEKNTCCAAPTH